VPTRWKTERWRPSLRADEKEVAEHVMLVDLGRNDVGRVSEFGSGQGQRPDVRGALLAM
jgi:anthranilate/para-aminobenzoate synthase component I